MIPGMIPACALASIRLRPSTGPAPPPPPGPCPQAPWLYLIETDFVFVKPIQAPGPAESAARSLAFLYTYITPAAPGLKVKGPPACQGRRQWHSGSAPLRSAAALAETGRAPRRRPHARPLDVGRPPGSRVPAAMPPAVPCIWRRT